MARKKAEQDSILLANRLRLLRAEEAKTQKKIRDTEKKTAEIVDLRRRNEERRLQREAEEEQREAQEQEMRERWMQQRGEQQSKVREKQRDILERNSEASKSQRQTREEQKVMIQDMRQEALSVAAAKHDRVKGMHRAATESRARSEDAKRAIANGLVEERVRREEQEKSVRLAEIARMEAEEADLISKLQRSQERHRAAYMQLEDAIRTNRGGGAIARSGLSTPSANSRCGDTLPQEALRSLNSFQPGTSASTGSRDGSSSASTSASGGSGSSSVATSVVSFTSASGGGGRVGGPPAAIGSRPPRPRAGSQPRVSAAALGVAAASAAIAAVSAASAPGSSAPSPTNRRGSSSSRLSAARGGGDFITMGKPAEKPPSGRLSSRSTASGGDPGSGRSTPATSVLTASAPRGAAPAAPPAAEKEVFTKPSYTTYDGMTLELPDDDDLDLASLLNS